MFSGDVGARYGEAVGLVEDLQPDTKIEVFYGATPTYSGFYTCNTWTIDALDKAGLQADPAGVLFASQAMSRVRTIAARPGR